MSNVSHRALLLMLIPLLACSSGRRAGSETASGRSSRDVLELSDLRSTGSQNVYDAVSALRSNWLRTRGPDSFSNPGQVWAYVDDVRAGGVDALRRISINEVTYVRYYDGRAASARWGLDHGHGVIFVSTRPRND